MLHMDRMCAFAPKIALKGPQDLQWNALVNCSSLLFVLLCAHLVADCHSLALHPFAGCCKDVLFLPHVGTPSLTANAVATSQSDCTVISHHGSFCVVKPTHVYW